MLKFFLNLLGFVAFVFHASAERPNVIVIVTDDIGYGDVGFHDIVADGVVTPNLDRLADSGVAFEEAYAASPICSDSLGAGHGALCSALGSLLLRRWWIALR